MGITACDGATLWSRALELADHMRKISLVASAVTYNASISACESGRMWELAVALFTEMKLDKLTLNHVTYNAMISVFEKCFRWQEAFAMLNDMRQHVLQPDTTTYGSAMLSCCRGLSGPERLDGLVRLSESMVSEGLAPDSNICGRLLAEFESEVEHSRSAPSDMKKWFGSELSVLDRLDGLAVCPIEQHGSDLPSILGV